MKPMLRRMQSVLIRHIVNMTMQMIMTLMMMMLMMMMMVMQST